MHESLTHIDHRPWPMPIRPWVNAQTWRDLLFAHWPLPPDVFDGLIPTGLDLDTFDGEAWIGVVPFEIIDFRFRPFPPLPPINQFLELNVRTYVTHKGKPGVWFFSLDAESFLAVRGARTVFNLPYFDARMTLARHADGGIHYSNTRTHRGAPAARFVGSYSADGEPFIPQPGSLEYFLSERYALYSTDSRGRLYRGDIHHGPWTLRTAQAEIRENTMVEAAGITLPNIPPMLHFANPQPTVVWFLERVR